MKNISTTLARIGALICAALFMLTLVPALLLLHAEERLFKSETYKQALQSSDIYERLPSLLAPGIMTSLAQADAPAASPDQQTRDYLKNLTVQDWQALILILLPPQETREFSEHSLDQLFDYLDGKSDRVALWMVPLKQHWSQKSVQAAEQILDAQPPCTLEQLLDMGIALAGGGSGESGLVLCKPPQEAMSTFLPVLDAGLQTQIAAIPDNLPLFDSAPPAELRARLGLLRLGARLGLLIPLSFLLLMTLLVVRSRATWLRWWGLTLVMAGVFGLLTVALVEPLARLLLWLELPHPPASLAPLIEAGLEVLLAVARQVTVPVTIETALAVLVGAIMLVTLRWLRPAAANPAA